MRDEENDRPAFGKRDLLEVKAMMKNKIERWSVAYGRHGGEMIVAPMFFRSQATAESYADKWREDGFYAITYRADDDETELMLKPRTLSGLKGSLANPQREVTDEDGTIRRL